MCPGDINAAIGGEFDSDEVEPSQTFEPIPTGWYNVIIDSAEVKETKKQNGYYLSIEFKIIDGQHTGRKVFANLNIQNPNQTAQEIALRNLSAIARSTGVGKVNDSSELLDQTLQIRITVTNDEEYGPGNDVKGFKPLGDKPPAGESVENVKNNPPDEQEEEKSSPKKDQSNIPPWKR